MIERGWLVAALAGLAAMYLGGLLLLRGVDDHGQLLALAIGGGLAGVVTLAATVRLLSTIVRR